MVGEEVRQIPVIPPAEGVKLEERLQSESGFPDKGSMRN